jgi:oligoribonuclease
MTSFKNKDHMVWIDMEMTGLDPENEGIIEIALLITDSELRVVAEGPDIVVHQPEKLLKKMDEWNQKQHKKSGLIDEVMKSKISVAKAEKVILDIIKEYCFPKKSLLCGNAVHHDRRFLIKYMPKIHEYLHYRHVDVSSVKDLIRRWYPKDKNVPEKSEQHRALSDIRESIEELRWYKEHYFKPANQVV